MFDVFKFVYIICLLVVLSGFCHRFSHTVHILSSFFFRFWFSRFLSSFLSFIFHNNCIIQCFVKVCAKLEKRKNSIFLRSSFFLLPFNVYTCNVRRILSILFAFKFLSIVIQMKPTFDSLFSSFSSLPLFSRQMNINFTLFIRRVLYYITFCSPSPLFLSPTLSSLFTLTFFLSAFHLFLPSVFLSFYQSYFKLNNSKSVTFCRKT